MMTLPCSSETTAASSSTWPLTSSRNANNALARVLSDDADHCSNASEAARDGGIDFFWRGERDFGRLLTAGRVEDRPAPARGRPPPACPRPNAR